MACAASGKSANPVRKHQLKQHRQTEGQTSNGPAVRLDWQVMNSHLTCKRATEQGGTKVNQLRKRPNYDNSWCRLNRIRIPRQTQHSCTKALNQQLEFRVLALLDNRFLGLWSCLGITRMGVPKRGWGISSIALVAIAVVELASASLQRARTNSINSWIAFGIFPKPSRTL